MKMTWYWLIMVVCIAMVTAGAQTDTAPAQADSSQMQDTVQPQDQTGNPQPLSSQEATAGQDNAATAVPQAPPLTSLDQPVLHPETPPTSFLLPTFQLLQGADTNVNQLSGSRHVAAFGKLFGSLGLQRFWRRYEVEVNYVGGGLVQESNTSHGRVGDGLQAHTLEVLDKYMWRHGAFQLRDGFTYLPEGLFGFGSFGGMGGFQSMLSGTGGAGGPKVLGGGTGTSFFSPAQIGTVSDSPRYSNVAIGDLQEGLSPRTTITLAGSYGLLRFLGHGSGMISSHQANAQAGYNYAFGHNQIAVVYRFGAFSFPGFGRRLQDHGVLFLYGRDISGRWSIKVGGGPVLTRLITAPNAINVDTSPGNETTHAPAINSTSLRGGTSSRRSWNATGSVRYQFPLTQIALFYDHLDSGGSGFYFGARTDLVHLTVSRPLSRTWTGNLHLGYSHNRALSVQNVGATPFAARQSYYDAAYAGGGLSHVVGRHTTINLNYQFGYQVVGGNNVGCSGKVSIGCNSVTPRHMGSIGLSWHPDPIRIE